MNKFAKKLVAIAAAGVIVFSLAACSGASQSYTDRKELQEQTTLQDSQELKNLEAKRELENDPNKERYLYVISFGTIFGYYVTKGKISSNASQIAPELDIIDPCNNSYCPLVVDSSKDDGSYGAGDPGLFFFTSDGVYVETDLNYILSDAPIAVDVPRLLK